MKVLYCIGIDPGVNTGLGVWDITAEKLIEVRSFSILEAQKYVMLLVSRYGADHLFVRFEDARLRTWFGNAGREQLQGAGSIKRDCSIWEEFLTSQGIPYQAVAPKNNRTKMSSGLFTRYTGWTGKTNEHARDAAMLCFQYNPNRFNNQPTWAKAAKK